MTRRQEYLFKAADLSAKAQTESDGARKSQLENLARAYLRLAAQLKHSSAVEIVDEPPPKKDSGEALE